jgi:hypothetical protein
MPGIPADLVFDSAAMSAAATAARIYEAIGSNWSGR